MGYDSSRKNHLKSKRRKMANARKRIRSEQLAKKKS